MQHSEVVPASEVHEYDVHYVDNLGSDMLGAQFNMKNFGGFHIQKHKYIQKNLKKTTDKFWVWFSFGITSLAIIGLMAVFNKLKKNFNNTY